jgi:hypothetical protein
MFARTRWYLAGVLAMSLAWRAAGQAPVPDLRALSLRSLAAGRTIRISGREMGTLTGPIGGVHDDALWLGSGPAARGVPLAGIDSVWVSRGHVATGALVGTLVGAVVAVAVMSGKTCELGDSGCLASGSAALMGITLSGTLLGAAIGGGARSWQLRYP